MRKYYTKVGIQATDIHAPVSGKHHHWSILEVYLNGLPDVWRPETKAMLLSTIKNRDVASLLSIASDLDTCAQSYARKTKRSIVRWDRQTVCLLKKFPFSDIETPFNTRDAAIKKWQAAEDRCLDTNRRIGSMQTHELPSFVFRAQRLIGDVLEDLTPRLLMSILERGTHGPGSTLSSNRNRTTPYYKYMDFPYTVTQSAAPYALAAISQSPRWLDLLESSGRRSEIPPFGSSQSYRELTLFKDCVEIVDSDKITFVPKDAKTDRPIAVGASLNLYLQLAVKQYMEARLKLVGVDLKDQERNQEMARLGSKFCYVAGELNNNQFSTIDLASASDTISHEIVKLLLPPEWYAMLDDLRHKEGHLDGNKISYEKFSAMGNGFTFPLESLIFWALSRAAIEDTGDVCQTKDLAVYGDDIIVRYKHAPSVTSALLWAGFEINTEKSFVSGSFKESCGADFYAGYNVRPFYLKREVRNHEDIYFICNSIAEKVRSSGFCPGLAAAYSYCLSLVPRGKRRFAPLTGSIQAGLKVPYSHLADLGLRPWLQGREQQHLRSKRLLKPADMHLHSNYWVKTEPRAISYKGYSKARLFLSFLGKMDYDPKTFFADNLDKVVFEASVAGAITRRKAVKHVTTVAPVSNWDGDFSNRQLANHIINFVNLDVI